MDAAGSPSSHDQIVRRLAHVGASLGSVVVRVAWADWDRWPGVQRILAEEGFDTRFVVVTPGQGDAVFPLLQTEVNRQLEAPGCPDVIALGSTSATLLDLVEQVRDRGKEPIVIARGSRLPAGLVDHPQAPRIISLGPSPEEDRADEETQRPAREGSSMGRDRDEVLLQIRAALMDVMAERRLPWVSFRLFCNHLVARGVTSAEDAGRWIERAVACGYVRREEEQGAVRRFYKFVPGRVPGGSPARGGAGGARPAPLFPPRGSSGSDKGFLRGDLDAATGSGRPGRSGRSGWNQDWRNFTFVRMLWALRSALESRAGRSYLTPRWMVDVLLRAGVGQSEEEVFFWVNQAVDRGVLLREIRDGDRPGGQRFHRYYLNHRNQVVKYSEVVPRAVLQTISVVLRRRPEWRGIAFNFLVRLLRVHPALSNPADALHVHRIREWLNFLLDQQVLIKFEEPDLRDPSRRTTMVANNLEHAETRRFLREAQDAPFFHPEHQAVLRAILMIDHFLYWLRTKSPDEDWLPLMTLKSWLRSSLGDQLAKWAVAECEEGEIFTIDRYQNKGGGEATVAGVRLCYTHPLVAQTLARRDHFLRMLFGLLRNRATVPYEVLEKRLVNDPELGDTDLERLGWFALMVDSKVITLEEADITSERRSGYVCRVSAREKFVGELITRVIRGEGFAPSPAGAGGFRTQEESDSRSGPDESSSPPSDTIG